MISGRMLLSFGVSHPDPNPGLIPELNFTQLLSRKAVRSSEYTRKVVG